MDRSAGPFSWSGMLVLVFRRPAPDFPTEVGGVRSRDRWHGTAAYNSSNKLFRALSLLLACLI